MITFYSEANEIGGNKILVQENDTKIWLDFGLSFQKAFRYINWILEGSQLRRVRIDELSRQQIIPPLNVIEGKISVFLTHAHIDHCGALEILLSKDFEVDIYAPEDLLRLYRARMILGHRHRLLSKAVLKPLRVNSKNKVYDFEVIPIKVDHSIDASYSYLIFTPEYSIFYTGDIRFDIIGLNQIVNKIKKFSEGTDLNVITELTGTAVRTPIHERDIPNHMIRISQMYDGFIIIFTSPSYTKRIESVRKAFNNRELVVHASSAYYLYELGRHNLIDKIFISSKKTRLTSWEKELCNIFSNDIVDESYLERNQTDIVLIISPYHKLKIDFEFKPRSVAIISLSEPYNEDGFYEQRRLRKYLEHWKEVPMYYIHASGHAEVYEIAQFLNIIDPNKIFVIHSSCPKILQKMLPKRRNIVIPRYGQQFKI